MDRNGHPNLTGHLRNMPDVERDQNTVKMHPHKRDKRLKEFARIWLNGPLPADLMADLADIMDDEDYTPEKRAHQIVWQAIKWGMEQ